MYKLLRFLKDWLTNGYSDKRTVEEDTSLPSEVKKALLGVHKRHNHVANEPSKMDIQLLVKLYGTWINLNQQSRSIIVNHIILLITIYIAVDNSASKCTIQGPPPLTKVECVLNNKEGQKGIEKIIICG